MIIEYGDGWVVTFDTYDGVPNSAGVVNGDVRPDGVPLEALWVDPPGEWQVYNVYITDVPDNAVYDSDLDIWVMPVDYIELPLFMLVRDDVYTDMSLTCFNSDSPALSTLPISFKATEHDNMVGYLSTFLKNEMENELLTDSSGQLNLYNLGSNALVSRYPNVSMNLFTDAPLILAEELPITLYGDDYLYPLRTTEVTSSGISSPGLNLHLTNVNEIGGEHLLDWNSTNYGTGIELRDEIYPALSADNEIRGVDLIGYGSCDGDSPRKAIDPAVVTDETVWRPETCNDGGIFRAISTYTNSTAVGFGGSIGYSGNYYDIRKQTGLNPSSPYLVTMNITTGSTEAIKVPRNFEDWEYGTCGPMFGDDALCVTDCEQNIAYSGVKLIGDYPYLSGDPNITSASGRNTGDNYGRSVAIDGKLMAVGSPRLDIPDGSGHTISNAGSVFLYRREEDIAGQKAAWYMEDKLMLPSGSRRDYVTGNKQDMIMYGDLNPIQGQEWNIGQEGREFGHSIDVCSSGDREVVVVGAPHASWSRQFTEPTVSGVPICMIVLVDELNWFDAANQPVGQWDVQNVGNVAKKWDILYKYFSKTWPEPESFQPKLEIKLIVCQLAKRDTTVINRPDISHDYDGWFHHVYIDRLDDPTLKAAFELTPSDEEYISKKEIYDGMLSGVQDAFFEMFPRKQEKLHSGVPPIVGFFSDNSLSTIGGESYKFNESHNIVDEFISFYKDYSYKSGVLDYFADPTKVAATGYVNKSQGFAEAWRVESIRLIDETLATGNLISTNSLKFITEAIGNAYAQIGFDEFQIPPSSGGRVFIFEKESGLYNQDSGVFNCVQEIKSPSDRNAFSHYYNDPDEMFLGSYGTQYNDKYGHSVSISKNAEVIAVGSPYLSTPCEVYERDESENTRMYNAVRDFLAWSGISYDRYDKILADSGAAVAQRVVYHELSPTNRFALRVNEDFWSDRYQKPISLYGNKEGEGKPIYEYSYGDIKTTGTYQFVLNEYLGTSRLGYSSSVNDDGKTVAFGAPTDSMNVFEDSNVWYNGSLASTTWGSYTNAGAVRIFEAREYHKHSGVVEFTKFGNLDRSLHLENEEYYNKLGTIFDSAVNPYWRTEHSDLEIPKNAGLSFIITPTLDAVSDEIIENIKDWLSLGDRTLVLVGNDPLYEDNGRYAQSNKIVNEILEKLGSRMRIQAAKTKRESLPDGVSVEEKNNLRYNVTEAKKPQYSHTSINGEISNYPIFASGVGDIRIDLSDLEFEESSTPCKETPGVNPLNPICSPPLKHNGDLRAEWWGKCEKELGNKTITYRYRINWPFHFANTDSNGTPLTESYNCDDYPESPRPLINKPNQDIVPILTAAEYIPGKPWLIPAWDRTWNEYTPVYETIKTETKHSVFDGPQINIEAFGISGHATQNEVIGNFLNFDPETFYDPDIKRNTDGEPVGDRNPILRAVGVRDDGDDTKHKRTVLDHSNMAIHESGFHKYTDGTRVGIAHVKDSSWDHYIPQYDPDNTEHYIGTEENPVHHPRLNELIEYSTNASVFILASVLGENQNSMTGGGEGVNLRPIGNNHDENILFYVNIIKGDCDDWIDNKIKILQLGGWTGRDSFEAAYPYSILKGKLEDFGSFGDDERIKIEENFEFKNDNYEESKLASVLWIANPIGEPEEGDINNIKRWLKDRHEAGKMAKIVITYSAYNGPGPDSLSDDDSVHAKNNGYSTGFEHTQKIASSVDTLCSGLNITSRPLKINVDTNGEGGTYFVQYKLSTTWGGRAPNTTRVEFNNMVPFPSREEWESDDEYSRPYLRSQWHENSIQKLDLDSEAISGCKEFCGTTNTCRGIEGIGTELDKVLFADQRNASEGMYGWTGKEFGYVPISGGGDFREVIYYEDPVEVPYTLPNVLYTIDADASIKFPAEPGSGYRVYVNWLSEDGDDWYYIDAIVKNIHFTPFQEDDPSLYTTNKYRRLGRTLPGDLASDYLDVQVPWDSDSLTISFDTHDHRKINPRDGVAVYATPRIMSISGCLLPYVEETVNVDTQVHIDTIVTPRVETNPAIEGVDPEVYRPIKHMNRVHCSSCGGLITDSVVYNPDDLDIPPDSIYDSETNTWVSYIINCSECGDCPTRCGNGKTEIEDGPVVVAEEFEHFSSFARGNERSRIVVIADSTIIQGVPHYWTDTTVDSNLDYRGNRRFIRSLYPTSPTAEGRVFDFVQKIRSPEGGSPSKYYAASGLAGTLNMFGEDRKPGSYGSLQNYGDDEDLYDPSNPGFLREADPAGKGAEDEKEDIIENFLGDDNKYTTFPRFSGDFLGTSSYTIGGSTRQHILDAGAGGGIPDLMKITGRDYLDFDIYNSGCPGDLFGYSVDLTQDRLIVGTPFNAFHTEEAINSVSGIVTWASVSGDDNPSRSGLRISANGGAGAAFYFEKTGKGKNIVSEYLPWEFKQKIKPSSVNVGLDCTSSCVAALQVERGDHNLDGTFILANAHRTDQFGHSVSIDSDMIAIGAPNHDFETLHHHIYKGDSAFLRKSFNAEFAIPQHSYYDLGSSGMRYDQFDNNGPNESGTMVLNNGAVFSYRQEMEDWQTRNKEWQFAEKLYAQGGFKDRSTTEHDGGDIDVSGCENDYFGASVAISRTKRGDSDYTLIVGSPNHDFATSGDHPLSALNATQKMDGGLYNENGLLEAGAAYTYDAMLRGQLPTIPIDESFIVAEVFGERTEDNKNRLQSSVYQNTTGGSVTHSVSGIVYPDSNGSLFLEASGYDPATKGFIAHRPFIESVTGVVLKGIDTSGSLFLLTSGGPVTLDSTLGDASGMNIVLSGARTANVYNNMALYEQGVIDVIYASGYLSDAGLYPASGLNVTLWSPEVSGMLNLYVSGQQPPEEQLKLKIRGA